MDQVGGNFPLKLIASSLDLVLLPRDRQLFLREKTLEIDAVNTVITLVSDQKYAFPLKWAELPNQPL